MAFLLSSRQPCCDPYHHAARSCLAWEGWLKDDVEPNLKRKLNSYSRHCPCAYLQRCCLAHSRTWRTHCVLRMRNRSSKKRVATSAVSGERAELEAVST